METTEFSGRRLSRLMLGTVQLGLPYGIANRTGQPSYEDARAILACAYEGSVNCIDTASAYGQSEEVLGRALSELELTDKVMVVTKVHHMVQGLEAAAAADIIEESVVRSLKRLRLEVLPVCLFHIEENFAYVESLLRLKERGLVQHVGSSVMSPAGTAAILETGIAEALQIPTSVLDRRYSHPGGGLIARAGRSGVAVFVRSIYLQGLLHMPEQEILPQLAGVIPVRRRLAHLAAEAGMTLAELAARYILGLDGALCAVVGIETLPQMRENVALFSRGPLDMDLRLAVEAAVPELPDDILMPTRWPRRMEVKPLEGRQK